jgi:hypothetical protein
VGEPERLEGTQVRPRRLVQVARQGHEGKVSREQDLLLGVEQLHAVHPLPEHRDDPAAARVVHSRHVDHVQGARE